jgi:hypothetical protein
MDLAMNPHDGDTWISVRDERIRMPIEDATFERDGIRYLRPEIVIAMKARWERHKDEIDFAQMLPRLDATQQRWLRETIEQLHPGHSWLRLIDA